MLAQRVKQKDGTFYFVSYRAPDILRHLRFLHRYYYEGSSDADAAVRQGEEDIASFITSVERSDKAFQRTLIQRKLKELLEFYESAQTQPMIPGPVLLYTPDVLTFKQIGGYQTLGDLVEPSEPLLIIDGQHRLAALRLFQQKHPEDIDSIEVPAIIFDGKQENFAAEMFVIINSTHTRITKSHLIDLMEKVTYGTSREKKWAAWIVTRLYEDARSPLRYKINKLGGRSRQEKWILQSELFNEMYRLVEPDESEKKATLHDYLAGEFGWERRGPAPELFIDYFQAVQEVMAEVWGNKNFMFTTSVTIKALVRVLNNLLADETVRKEWREERSPAVFKRRIAGWRELVPEFRKEGFYERFPAKGQIERTRKIHGELAKRIQ